MKNKLRFDIIKQRFNIKQLATIGKNSSIWKKPVLYYYNTSAWRKLNTSITLAASIHIAKLVFIIALIPYILSETTYYSRTLCIQTYTHTYVNCSQAATVLLLAGPIKPFGNRVNRQNDSITIKLQVKLHLPICTLPYS